MSINRNIFKEKGEPKREVEPASFRLPAERLTPLGQAAAHYKHGCHNPLTLARLENAGLHPLLIQICVLSEVIKGVFPKCNIGILCLNDTD